MLRKLAAFVVVGGAFLSIPNYGYGQNAGGGYCDNGFTRQASCPPTLGALSLALEPGMTEDDLERLQPLQPYSASLETCGQKSQSGEWECKTWEYGDGTNALEVWFYQDNKGVWRVNNWEYNPS